MRDMGYDAEVMQRVINDHDLSVKQVARAANKHINVVYSYLTGYRNIPIDMFRVLLSLTKDARIIALVTGEIPIEIEFIEDVPDLADNADVMKEAIRLLGEYHELQKRLVDIIADGRIDQSDAAAVRSYNDQYIKYRNHSIALHRAINKAFNRATQRTRKHQASAT